MILEVLDRLDARYVTTSVGLAGLDPHASLLVEKLDEGIVRHIFTSMDEPFSLNFNIVLELLKVFVQRRLRLYWCAYSLRVHVIHVWEAHPSELSVFTLVVLIKRVFQGLRVLVILVLIALSVHNLADRTVFIVQRWSEEFFNGLDSPEFYVVIIFSWVSFLVIFI